MEQVLAFIRTKHQANRLAEQLSIDGYEAKVFHSNKSQGVRTHILNSFKQDKIRVLVATDIAARGIDIQDLPHVINYDLPQIVGLFNLRSTSNANPSARLQLTYS